jgi:GDPmannose 4,6-dehydratase
VHASAEHAAYEPIFANMLAVNVSTVHAVLEHLRTQDPAARLVYASSAKAFGSPVPSLVNEHTPRKSSCLYGITKNTAGDLIRYYRNAHNVLASQLFLFNHESELRPPGFFIPKLVNALRAASRGACHQERFHTLDFYCDWGSADEYMSIMIDALERAPAEDFVLATGRTVHARTLAQQLFARFEAPMDDYVLEATEHTKAREYTVDIGRLKSLGLAPKVTIEQLIEDLVTARE